MLTSRVLWLIMLRPTLMSLRRYLDLGSKGSYRKSRANMSIPLEDGTKAVHKATYVTRASSLAHSTLPGI